MLLPGLLRPGVSRLLHVCFSKDKVSRCLKPRFSNRPAGGRVGGWAMGGPTSGPESLTRISARVFELRWGGTWTSNERNFGLVSVLGLGRRLTRGALDNACVDAEWAEDRVASFEASGCDPRQRSLAAAPEVGAAPAAGEGRGAGGVVAQVEAQAGDIDSAVDHADLGWNTICPADQSDHQQTFPPAAHGVATRHEVAAIHGAWPMDGRKPWGGLSPRDGQKPRSGRDP